MMKGKKTRKKIETENGRCCIGSCKLVNLFMNGLGWKSSGQK